MRDLPKPVPVEVALNKTGINIEVPDGESLTIGPFEPHYHEAFRLAEVSTFDDLHRLGFIPNNLTEQEARVALLADDRAYRELSIANGATTQGHETCSCSERQPRQLLRRMLQSNLIEALQPSTTAFLDPKNPTVFHAYFHLRSFFSNSAKMIVGINVLEDITIGDRATLTMTPTVNALYANDVTIGGSGTLRFNSGAVHVRCRTLNGPSRFTERSSVVATAGRYLSGLSREARRPNQ